MVNDDKRPVELQDRADAVNVQDSLDAAADIRKSTTGGLASIHMTCRDVFAAHCLPAMVTIVNHHPGNRGKPPEECMAIAAQHAYDAASAMLIERAKPVSPPPTKGDPENIRYQILSYGAHNVWLDLIPELAPPQLKKMAEHWLFGIEIHLQSSRYRVIQGGAE